LGQIKKKKKKEKEKEKENTSPKDRFESHPTDRTKDRW
jgi:hypothetical protein